MSGNCFAEESPNQVSETSHILVLSKVTICNYNQEYLAFSLSQKRPRWEDCIKGLGGSGKRGMGKWRRLVETKKGHIDKSADA